MLIFCIPMFYDPLSDVMAAEDYLFNTKTIT